MQNKKILFVGGFKKGLNGSTGGQVVACTTLLNSTLKDQYDWLLLDSTAPSNIIDPLYVRGLRALKRFLKFFYFLSIKKVDRVLIFTGDGFSFWEKGTMALFAKLFGKKVILAPRSGFIVNDMNANTKLSKFIPFVLNRVDTIICQGESWKIFFENLVVNKQKCNVIQNWINFDDIDFKEKSEENLRILFLGWVDRQKGILDFLQALSILKLPDNIFVDIAGDGMAMKESQEFALTRHLSNVSFHGWVNGENKKMLLQDAHIFILPSYAEGFPNSLLEAMAYGCACIATDVGSVSDLISHSINGLIIKPGNVDSIVRNIELIVHNRPLLNRIGDAGRESVLLNNSLDAAVMKFNKILN